MVRLQKMEILERHDVQGERVETINQSLARWLNRRDHPLRGERKRRENDLNCILFKYYT